ncbi:MAG: MJ0042-type zinc finger domain-containing protein [Pseudomonadota bacterium]
MILTCPECDTQYFAEDSTIGDSGRTVKCAACGHSWFVGPEGAAPSPQSRQGAHEAYRLKVRERRRRKSRSIALMSWVSTVAAAAAIVGGSILLRDQVARIWPQSATAFTALGFEVNRFGLEFVDTQAERFFDGTTPILEVRGTVRNLASQTVAAPRVRVVLLNDEGTEVARAIAPVSPSNIPGEAMAQFLARVENPPFEAFELELSFVPVDQAEATTGFPVS